MSRPPQIWTPSQPKQTEKVVVLEHHQTHRLLMLLDDEFANFVAKHGYIKHEVNTAAEYDAFAKKIIAQDRSVSDAEDARMAERRDAVRKRLRDELHTRLLSAQPSERREIEDALKALEIIQQRKERVRDSYFMRQGYDDSRKDAGEELAKRIITNNNG